MSTTSPEYIFATPDADGSDGLLAIVIRKIADQVKPDETGSAVKFFTTKDCAQQAGYIKHAKGHIIPAHFHPPERRLITSVPETLMVVKGRLLVEFYCTDRQKECGRVLEAGDVVVLLCGGHGFEVMEDVEIFEVRQGPYLSDKDKVRFESENVPKENLQVGC